MTNELPPLVIDVRALLAQGQSPCDPIDEAIARLAPRQKLVLIAPFEPVPLFAKLGRQGFVYHKEALSDGTWKIEFWKDETAAEDKPRIRSISEPPAGAKQIRLDNRGLEPPEPLVRTLEALPKLGSGEKLTMLSDRKPIHLFPELERRGFSFDCTEQPDHSFVTVIWSS